MKIFESEHFKKPRDEFIKTIIIPERSTEFFEKTIDLLQKGYEFSDAFLKVVFDLPFICSRDNKLLSYLPDERKLIGLKMLQIRLLRLKRLLIAKGEKELILVLSVLHQDCNFTSLHLSNNFIFNDLPTFNCSSRKSATSSPSTIPYPRYSVIANNEGYIEDSDRSHGSAGNVLKGEVLRLDDDDPNSTPIGYNVFIPKDVEIKAIMVEVYGGHKKQDRLTKAYSPSSTNTNSDKIVAYGIALIRLNLPDLLELEVDQQFMPRGLSLKMHACINRFFEVIHNNPKSLHDNLETLAGLPIYLKGDSYGGRTAVRQGELYPESFDGYISFAGSLSYEQLFGSGPNMLKQSPNRMHLDVLPELRNLQKPVLVFQNYDDNNVRLPVAIYFYNKAIEAKKNVQLVIIPYGSKIQRPNPDDRTNDRYKNKGHFLTKDPYYIDYYYETLASFMLDGPSSLPELSAWRAHSYDIYCKKNHGSYSVVDKFISEAYRVYKNALKFRGTYQGIPSLILEELIYHPLLGEDTRLHARIDATIENILQGKSKLKGIDRDTFNHEDVMDELHQSSPALYNILLSNFKESRLVSADNFYRSIDNMIAWKRTYLPLYFSIYAVDAHQKDVCVARETVNHFNSHELLTPEIIDAALDIYLDSFIPFIEEAENITIPDGFDRSKLKKAIEQEFRKNISEQHDLWVKDSVGFNLYFLLMANPKLVDHIPKLNKSDMQRQSKQAKVALITAINANRRKIGCMMMKAAKLYLKKFPVAGKAPAVSATV